MLPTAAYLRLLPGRLPICLPDTQPLGFPSPQHPECLGAETGRQFWADGQRRLQQAEELALTWLWSEGQRR